MSLCLQILLPLVLLVVGFLQDRRKASLCQHETWVEVTSGGFGVVAYLCLNQLCGVTLYPEEWKPAGCHCKPELEQYHSSCPVKNHSGKALLLREPQQRVSQAGDRLLLSELQAADKQFAAYLKNLYGEVQRLESKKYCHHCYTNDIDRYHRTWGAISSKWEFEE